jgi:hypothetical protein
MATTKNIMIINGLPLFFCFPTGQPSALCDNRRLQWSSAASLLQFLGE